jgi:hypothetical protein
MNAKTFDLADWRSRLDQAVTGDDLLALAREIHARNEGQTHPSELLPTQNKAVAQGEDKDWAAIYKTQRMQTMAAKALVLSNRRR